MCRNKIFRIFCQSLCHVLHQCGAVPRLKCTQHNVSWHTPDTTQRQCQVVCRAIVSPPGQIGTFGAFAAKAKNILLKVQHQYAYFMCFRSSRTPPNNSNTNIQEVNVYSVCLHILKLAKIIEMFRHKCSK